MALKKYGFKIEGILEAQFDMHAHMLSQLFAAKIEQHEGVSNVRAWHTLELSTAEDKVRFEPEGLDDPTYIGDGPDGPGSWS